MAIGKTWEWTIANLSCLFLVDSFFMRCLNPGTKKKQRASNCHLLLLKLNGPVITSAQKPCLSRGIFFLPEFIGRYGRLFHQPMEVLSLYPCDFSRLADVSVTFR